MIRVGIIGAGGIAAQHAWCYEHIPEAKIMAVADIIQERAQELAGKFGAEALNSGDLMFDRDDLDMVDICLPTYLHCEYVLKAAAKGLHVLCEKPIALDVEQGVKMIEAAESAGAKFMVAQVLRFFPENVNAKKVIASGSIGKPVMARTYRGGVHPARVRDWYGHNELSGGAIQDMAIHDIDFLMWCFGSVRSVYAKGNPFENREFLEYDLVTLEFECGLIAHLTADWSRPESGHFTTRMEIVGTEGLVEYDGDKSAPLMMLQAAQGGEQGSVAIPESPLEPRSNPYSREIIGFLQSIEKGLEPPIPPREALEALRVARAALQSIKTGKPVELREAE